MKKDLISSVKEQKVYTLLKIKYDLWLYYTTSLKLKTKQSSFSISQTSTTTTSVNWIDLSRILCMKESPLVLDFKGNKEDKKVYHVK